MDPFDPLFSLADDDPSSTNPTTTSTSDTFTGSAQQDLLDLFGGGDTFPGSSCQQQALVSDPTVDSVDKSPSGEGEETKQDLCDLTDNMDQDLFASSDEVTQKPTCNVPDLVSEEPLQISEQDIVSRNSGDLSDGADQEPLEVTLAVGVDADQEPHEAMTLAVGVDADQEPHEAVTLAVGVDEEESSAEATPQKMETTEVSEAPQMTVFAEDGGGGSDGVAVVDDPFDGLMKTADQTCTELTEPPAPSQSDPQQNELFLSQEDTTVAAGETNQPGSKEDTSDLLDIMETQGETHGGTFGTTITDNILDDFFGTTSLQPTTNGVLTDTTDTTLRLEEFGITENGDASTSMRLAKEGSPEIVIDSTDSVEDVTLKDATSEKTLLGNKGEEDGTPGRLGSGTSEDQRKSSSDIDMDFAVLELDSSHLNLDMSKQKSSLRKKGSLARRKKPSRGSGSSLVPGSPDSIFQDSTDSKPVTSPTKDTAEDDVFDTPTEPPADRPSEVATVRKSALPFKPAMVMPGLQDLSKSKLFSQERRKSGESPTSPIKSPVSGSSPLLPSSRPVPPLLLPKPATKVQKDSQNMTIAAENSSVEVKSNASSGVSNGEVITAGVVEELVITRPGRTDSSSSDARTDSGSLSGPKPARTDSWSSVSSPRRLSRGESVSSVEGGEGGSANTTPRRASIQGSAYAPIGFRPRRGSSIVLDSNNKLVDSPAPPSPSPSPASATPSVEEDPEAPPSSGLKSPLYKAPVWLSEMKAKAGSSPGDSNAHLRTTSNDSNEESVSSPRSRNGSGSSGSVGGSTRGNEGVQRRSIFDEVNQKKRETQEPEKPSWMKAAQEKTTRMADKLQTQKEDEEDGDGEEDKQPVPPWAAELRKKNRSSVVGGSSNGKVSTNPFQIISSGDKENTPVANSGRDQYTPSWMKSGRQLKKPPVPLPGSAAKAAANSTDAAVKGSSANRMKAYETPKWKLDLAEKKKRREAEMMPAEDGGSVVSEYRSPASNAGSSSSSSDVPEWKRKLSQRKKPPVPDHVSEAGTESSSGSSAGPDWAKQAAERRERLRKSGLLDQASENASDNS